MYKLPCNRTSASLVPAMFLFLIVLISSFKLNTEVLGDRDMMKPDHALSDQMELYDIKFYRFDLEVSNANREVSGMAEFHALCLSDQMDTLVMQLSNSMTIDSVLINDLNHLYIHADQLLKVPVNLFANQDFIANIYYHGTPVGGFFKGIHRQYSNEYDRWVTWSFSQPFYAYKWFPCKQIHSDKIDSVHMVLRTDSTLTAVSSGRLHEKTPLDSGMVMFDWRTKYAISYDMIFFAVSEYMLYDFYVQPQGYDDSILITHYVYNQDYLDDYKDRLDSIGLFVDYYSEIYGLYPFADENYGLVVVPGVPCMIENNTLVVMPEELDFGSTHTFIDGNCHELTHQWFGDYVACYTFEDIWLSEGFGMYGGYIGEQKFGNPGEAEKWLNKTRTQAFSPQCGSVHVPENQLLNASRIFNWQLTYCKGSMLVHMIRNELQDDELFFTVLTNYINEFANGTSFLADFKSVLEETTGKDFTSFFDQWYYGEGYPLLDISWEQDNGMLHLYSRESSTCDTTPLFNFTMDYQLVFADGDSIIRLYQSDTLNQYIIPIARPILEIIPDPNKWILAKTYIGHVSIKENPLPFAMEIFPNPCSNSARLLITGHASCLPAGRSRVTNIDLYSISGKKIRRAFEGEKGPGTYEEVLDVHDLPAGVYFIRLQAGREVAVRKLIVTK